MGKLWMKFWVWTKIVVFGLLFIYVVIFCATNHAHSVKVWLWYGSEREWSALTLIVGSFLAGVVATILIRTILVTLRQLHEIKERHRQERMQREFEEMRAKADMLSSKPVATPVVTPRPSDSTTHDD